MWFVRPNNKLWYQLHHWFEPICFLRLISLYVNKTGEIKVDYQLSIQGSAKIIKSRIKIKHFSIVGLMSPGWVRTQVRTHSDFCWTRGLGLGFWPTGLGLGLWSNGLGLGLGLWSNGLGLTPDGLGLWPNGLGLGLGLWPCGLGLTAGLTSPDSLQHCLQAANSCVDLSLQTRVWDFQNTEVHGLVIRNQNERFQLNIAQFHQ